MTRAPSRRAVLLAITAVGPLAACAETAKPVGPNADMNQNDLDFVTNAQNIIQFDREECTVAQRQARSPAVREIAARLLADANEFDARLQPILQQAGIRPPSTLRTDLRIRLLHIRAQNGLDFDRSFIDDQIATHEEIINRQEMMSATPGMNAGITQLAMQGAVILKRNLAELRRLQRQMMTG